MLAGRVEEEFYDEKGNLTDTIDMVPGGVVLNIEKGQWHSLNYKTPDQAYLETGEQVRVWKNYYKANKPEEVAHVIAELTSGCRTSATY